MAYQGDFDDWDDIDEIVARIEDASNSATGLPPSALFMEEKGALPPVGNPRAPEEAMGDVVRVARVPAYDPAHYAEAMVGKRWFGNAAGGIEAAAAANLGLLDSIGGSP